MSEGDATAEATDVQAEGQDTQTQDTQQETQDDPYARLESRMEQMQRDFQASQQQLIQSLQQPDEDPEEYQLDPGDDGYDEQEALRAFQELARQEAQQMVEPFMRQQSVEKRDAAYDSLTEQFPDLSDPEKAAPFVEQAAAWAEQYGAPGLIERPQFVDLIGAFYKAHVADERAARERPAQQPNVHLEQSGGAAPGAEEDDPQARMIARLQQKQGSGLL